MSKTKPTPTNLNMNISHAARQSGLSAKMIRHYEQIGLLNHVQRSSAGYREFSDHDIQMLGFIRQARVLGFPIEQIRSLLELWQDPQRSSHAVKEVATEHLSQVEEKLQELQAMKRTLEQMIRACADDDQPHCAILDGLAPRAP